MGMGAIIINSNATPKEKKRIECIKQYYSTTIYELKIVKDGWMIVPLNWIMISDLIKAIIMYTENYLKVEASKTI